jgi:protein-tyrosine phosphatase
MKVYSLLALCILLVFDSCGVVLSPEISKKGLREANYVENYKSDFELHLEKQFADDPIDVISPEDKQVFRVAKKPGETVVVLKRQRHRPLFRIVHQNDTIVVANRQVYFRDVVNFRDIGGIVTTEGRTVCWGKIYRSDNLSKLEKHEFRKLDELGIKTVYDLRTPTEIREKADNLPTNIKYFNTPTVADNGDLLSQMRGRVLRGEISDEESTQLMLALYRSCVSDNIPELRKLIYDLLNADAPELYHCSAGKDRTGVVTALLLSILKVDRDTILKEYMLSNYYRRKKLHNIFYKAKLARVVTPHIGLKAIENFMKVDEHYLNAAFDVIDTQYGGIDNYIQNELGISPELRKKAIEKFTY